MMQHGSGIDTVEHLHSAFQSAQVYTILLQRNSVNWRSHRSDLKALRRQFKIRFPGEAGTSIVEAMVATTVFLIVMLGGIQYFFLPQKTFVRQKIKRLAVAEARSRIETLRALDFTAITTDSNETGTAVTLAGITAFRSTTVAYVDDAADGLSGADADGQTIDYKTIQATVVWTAGRADSVSFTTTVSPVDFIGKSPFSSWGRKCELVIQASKVPGDVNNFPVLLTEANLPQEMFDADGTYPALNAGGDLRFTSDANGNARLACEVVTFTTDTNPANGKAEIWVNVPAITSAANTSFWVWYNKSGETQPADNEPYGAQAVWDANYLLVQHMNENPANPAPQFTDVTVNNYDGTNSGGLTAADLLAGPIGNCIKFDGAGDDDINLNAWDVAGSQITVQHWIYVNASPTVDGRFFSKAIGTAVNDHWIMTGIESNGVKLRFRLKTGSTTTNLEMTTGISANTWYFYAATYDGSNMRIWLDNQNEVTVAKTGAIAQNDTVKCYLGDNPTGLRQLAGRLDEVRISTVRRDDNWLGTEYNNQSDPATFVIAGTPQVP